MAAPLEWVFKLTDQMSTPAKKITDALGKTEKATEAATKATEALDKVEAQTAKTTDVLERSQVKASASATVLARSQEKVSDATAKASGATGGWSERLSMIGKGAAVAAAAITGVALAVGKVTSEMFRAAAAQDTTNRAFAGSLGGKGKGAQAYLGKITGSTELTANQLEALSLPLVRQGFDAKDLSRLIPAALDVQAEGGSAQMAIEQFAKLASTGRIEGEAYKALNLNEASTLASIGKFAGMSDIKEIKAAIAAGKIKSSDVLEGVLLEIAGGGELGQKAIDASKSPAAALNKLSQVWDTLFSSLAASPALPRITDAINALVKALTSDRAVEGVSKFFERIAAAIEKLDWEKVGNAVVGILDGLASVATIAAKLGLGVGGTIAQTMDDKDGRVPWWNPVAKFKSDFGLGEFANVPGAPSANDFVMRADGSVLNIDSADALIGFKPGGPIDRMVGAGGGGGMSIGDIIVHVSGGDTPEETGRTIAMEVRRNLINELDRMATEAG